jgi:hypothetical protein
MFNLNQKKKLKKTSISFGWCDINSKYQQTKISHQSILFYFIATKFKFLNWFNAIEVYQLRYNYEMIIE